MISENYKSHIRHVVCLRASHETLVRCDVEMSILDAVGSSLCVEQIRREYTKALISMRDAVAALLAEEGVPPC